nr:sensor histidine kinase [uncultured Dyadobacter sp.]
MVAVDKLVGVLARRKDTWLYLGLFCWISISFAVGRDDYWTGYFQALVTSLLLWSPVLIVNWVREGRGIGRFTGKNRSLWLGCFLGYLPAILIVSGIELKGGQSFWPVVFTGGLCIYALECILALQNAYGSRVRQWRWVRNLSLENAVLVSIIALAMLLGAMAVSSLDNPLYHSGKQLLIGFEIHFLKVVTHFPTFLSYSLQLLVMYLAGYFFFYFNSRWLVPVILKKVGILHYILCSAALVGVFYPLWGLLLGSLPFSKVLGGVFSANPFVAENAFGAALILVISLPVLLAIQWARQNSLITALQHEKSLAELDLLKQQMNPHFFFNTLNNLYALSLTRSERAPESILQLSELMRYVVYKAREPFVRISDEISYLQNYFHLQSIRLKDHDIRFELNIEDENFEIAPLLLVILVENAFKHGIEPADQKAFLHASLKVAPGKLAFSCLNTVGGSFSGQEGIGLINLKKRLNLIYPGRHQLIIKNDGTLFESTLELTVDA